MHLGISKLQPEEGFAWPAPIPPQRYRAPPHRELLPGSNSLPVLRLPHWSGKYLSVSRTFLPLGFFPFSQKMLWRQSLEPMKTFLVISIESSCPFVL